MEFNKSLSVGLEFSLSLNQRPPEAFTVFILYSHGHIYQSLSRKILHIWAKIQTWDVFFSTSSKNVIVTYHGLNLKKRWMKTRCTCDVDFELISNITTHSSSKLRRCTSEQPFPASNVEHKTLKIFQAYCVGGGGGALFNIFLFSFLLLFGGGGTRKRPGGHHTGCITSTMCRGKKEERGPRESS